MSNMTIPEFFKGRDIFITGGSGFMGKVLIEKLLRSCSELNAIYVLLRSKRNKSPEERLKVILDMPLFGVLRADKPHLLAKVKSVAGDVTFDDMGISADNMEELKNVSVVFHSAASVRFDDPLRDAIIMNTKGTLEVMKFAGKLKNVAAVMHVSTTYSNPDKHVIEEKLYPPYADWRTTLKLAEMCSAETLNILNAKYSGFQPNTYTFTKSLGEQIVNEYKDKLPVVIYRPSIVVSSVSEPIPGWIDNFNGPVGMFIASAVGILRTMHGDPDVASDYTPVDIAIKALIIAAYKKGIEKEKSNELVVYNCSTSNQRTVPYKHIIQLSKVLIKEHPMENMVWAPGGGLFKCRYYNYIRFLFFHVFLSFILDGILRVSGRKPFFLKLHKRIYVANLALSYFATTHWTFKNEQFISLDKFLPLVDREAFAFLFLKDIDLHIFFTNALKGAKLYLLNEPEECSKAARIRFKIVSFLNFWITVGFWVILGHLVKLFAVKFYKYFIQNVTDIENLDLQI